MTIEHVSQAVWPLDERPGFLIRRAHQIHVSLFAEFCGDFRVTPVQYSILSVLSDREGVDLTTLADLVALDRTTTTGALKRLEGRGLVRRSPSLEDRRAHSCALTAEGRSLHRTVEAAARRAHAATVGMLGAEEGHQLIALLKRIVATYEGRHEAASLT